MKKIVIVAGARPNFMKIAPIIHSIDKINEKKNLIDYELVHTGQHYDKNMSNSFFRDLNIPEPDINLSCNGGTQSELTGNIMTEFEKYLYNKDIDLVIVVGDVTSTMACSIAAKKMNIKVAHVEAGIRSGDLTMPEEINRLLTDSITDYFFTTSKTANINLINSGVSDKNIFFVGNTMIDTLLSNLNRLKKPEIWDKAGLTSGNYIIITLHRPKNVDEKIKLKSFIQKIVHCSKKHKLIFPMHPRTKAIFDSLELHFENLFIVSPLGYLEFNYLVKNSLCVITDSGGITEETTVLNIPCMTLRDNTERPETVDYGSNELVGTNPENLPKYFEILFSGNWKKAKIPELWDGNTAKRIVEIILNKI